MKSRPALSRKKPRRRQLKTKRNWKEFATSHGIFGAKAMSELKILVRLARQINDEFGTREWRRLNPRST